MQELIEELGTLITHVPITLRDQEVRIVETITPDQWSRREILGHLIDSAANNHVRFVNATLNKEVRLPSYEQIEWVKVQAYATEPWERLVNLWENYNSHLLHLIAHIPAEQLDNLCYVGDNPPMTLEALVKDYLDHMKHHLKDLAVLPN